MSSHFVQYDCKDCGAHWEGFRDSDCESDSCWRCGAETAANASEREFTEEEQAKMCASLGIAMESET